MRAPRPTRETSESESVAIRSMALPFWPGVTAVGPLCRDDPTSAPPGDCAARRSHASPPVSGVSSPASLERGALAFLLLGGVAPARRGRRVHRADEVPRDRVPGDVRRAGVL